MYINVQLWGTKEATRAVIHKNLSNTNFWSIWRLLSPFNVNRKNNLLAPPHWRQEQCRAVGQPRIGNNIRTVQTRETIVARTMYNFNLHHYFGTISLLNDGGNKEFQYKQYNLAWRTRIWIHSIEIIAINQPASLDKTYRDKCIRGSFKVLEVHSDYFRWVYLSMKWSQVSNSDYH